MSLGKLLIVDDDKNLCEFMQNFFEKEDFNVITANDGNEAIAKFRALTPDLVLLDIMLPYVNGWQICKEIRKISETPIIFVSAKSDVSDKVYGFELGADDYIVKPFEPKELIMRVKAVLKRTGTKSAITPSKCIKYDKLYINLTEFVLKVDGKEIETPPKELELLYFLASNPNQMFTRDQLLDEVWGFDYYGDSRTIDVHIKRLRYKLSGTSKEWDIKTVWGKGYKFEVFKEGDGET